MLCMLLLFHLNSIFLQWLLVGFRINLVHPHAFAMCKKNCTLSLIKIIGIIHYPASLISV